MHQTTAPAVGAEIQPAQDLTAQQKAAIDQVEDWYNDPRSGQVFRLFGYAGTGKTTLAKLIVSRLGLGSSSYDARKPLESDLAGDSAGDMAASGLSDGFLESAGGIVTSGIHATAGPALFAAFTGKAAHVLRTKGCDNASTVHSLIYTPVSKVRARLRQLEKDLVAATTKTERGRLESAIRVEKDRLAKPDFVLKEDSALSGAPLLVLDEVSMIGEKIAHDLLAFGARLLVLGDPAQLPPVEGNGWFINHPPDVLLTEIHRSAWDSPVTRLATAVRESPPGDRRLGLAPDQDSGPRRHIDPAELASFDQVLCGTNKTRWALNNVVRGLYGWEGPIPQPGEKVIVLANNAESAVFNGQQFVVGAAHPDNAQPDVLNVLALDPTTGESKVLAVWASGFVDAQGEKNAKRNGRSSIVAATFAHAITCHKSQGSQWDRVLVVDESSVFGRIAYHRNKDVLGSESAGIEAHVQRRRWCYTAITRAARQVVIVPGVDW